MRGGALGLRLGWNRAVMKGDPFSSGWPGCFREGEAGVGCKGASGCSLRGNHLQVLGGRREAGLAYLFLAPSWFFSQRRSAWPFLAPSRQSYSTRRRVSQRAEHGPRWHKHDKGLRETRAVTASVSERNSEGAAGPGVAMTPGMWECKWVWGCGVTPPDYVLLWVSRSSCSSQPWSGEKGRCVCYVPIVYQGFCCVHELDPLSALQSRCHEGWRLVKSELKMELIQGI